ncbi:hypothetical protein SAMN04489712_102609 [Thermomonospora echinospora]|uniref:DUF8094 domain-containing protein n=1 Tax=Thermomonospora echinospora TaxID=1992 RepID=A0A1H5W7A6_9ACTN|nr:hypothetical protein [Thermomonospora echinospora]SEF95106.1 hypothetical protein SAMN04489712_102609 [Thermomonospora echinospora]
MRRLVTGGVAGPLVLVAVLTGGCTGGGSDIGPDSDEAGRAPAVSVAESYRILRDWAERYNKAVASGDEDDWRDLTTGALRGPMTARARTYGRLPDSERISLRNPALYVPRLDGHPKWFAAAALDDVGGAAQQVLVLFRQEKAKEPWRAAHWLVFRGAPPKLDYDGHGYAIPAADGSLPSGHAAYLSTGDQSLFRPDRFTRQARDKAKRSDAPSGWSVTTRFGPDRHPVHGLRTDDGGSLVWYAVEQRRTFKANGSGRPDTLPADVRAHLTKAQRLSATRIEATWTWLAIGYVPPQGTANVLGESVRLSDVRT